MPECDTKYQFLDHRLGLGIVYMIAQLFVFGKNGDQPPSKPSPYPTITNRHHRKARLRRGDVVLGLNFGNAHQAQNLLELIDSGIPLKASTHDPLPSIQPACQSIAGLHTRDQTELIETKLPILHSQMR